ncbi:MAG: CoA-binding protein [Bacteroidales bacterium]|nr:CoA-binding protein [Bacteroidales bacterium]
MITARFDVHRKNLDNIFYPESVAIVGANNVRGTVPHDILDNILKANFNGVVYPVSPRERFIAGVKAYKYVIDIPDPVDLAILVFPSQVCHLALEQCGQKGIPAAIIISAGFREVGQAGKEREEELKRIAEKYGISFIGPNCLGVINTDSRSLLNASFARKMPEEGSISFLSQSGALCTAVLDYAQARNIGFAKFISFGNKADISEIDLLYYLKDDPKTRIILMYLEEITDGPALMQAAHDVIVKGNKPLLILKAGRTSEGAAAAASHTGSLAGSDTICDAAFAQAGIIRCETIEEMFNIATAYVYQPMPEGNRVAVITNAGGPGVLATDACIQNGLTMARFEEDTTQFLKKNLPATANVKNPVDVIGDARADRYNIALTAAFKDPNVDAVFTILTPQSMTDIDLIAREIAKVSSHYSKPVYTSFMGDADVREGIVVLQRNRIPHYQLPESMARSLAKVLQFKELRRKLQAKKIAPFVNAPQEAERILEKAVAEGKKLLTETDGAPLLRLWGIPVAESFLARTPNEAVQWASTHGFPVVMKISSEQILHKTDVGGVLLNLYTEDDVVDAYKRIIENVTQAMPESSINGILVEKQISGGEEIILGIKRDPSFGPVVMCGMGGIFAEIYRDVSFRIAPFGEEEAEAMLKELKAYPLLTGARGRIKRDVPSLVKILVSLSYLASAHPRIAELDINPLIVMDEGRGCMAADIKILLSNNF